MNAEKTET
jgi:hypothetical protein